MLKKSIICGVVVGVVLACASFSAEKPLFLQLKDTDENSRTASAPAVLSPINADANLTMQTFWLNYLDAKELKNTVKDLLAQGEGVALNEGTNSIVLRASSKNIDRVAKIVKKLDVAPLQVQVEAKIIELKSGSGDTNNPSSLGVEWKYTKNANNFVQLTDVVSGTASSLGLYAELLSGNTEAYLSALEKSIGYDLVASPWITAINHEESSILIGSKYGYKTTLTTQTGTLQNINFLEVGTKLSFTPHINNDGFIIMDVFPSVSEGSVTNDLPQENTTETRNRVLVKDGQSIVIGGLIKTYNNQLEIGVPVLSSLPFVGMLFRRTELRTEKREIMVLITPHIVTPQFLEEMNQKANDLNGRRDKWSKEKANLIH